MNKEFNHNIKLGIFVVTGVLLLVIGLYFIGNNKNMFGRTITIFATFQNVSGLQAGNNVRYAGIDIGTVDEIIISNDTTVRVEMIVNEDLKKIVRKNSIASVGTDGLMGNKVINIEPGTISSPLVNDGDLIFSIQALDTDEMLRTLEFTNQNVSLISVNIKNITDKIANNRGTLYKVLMDTSLAGGFSNTLKNLESMSHNFSTMSNDLSEFISEMKHGKGLAGTLINDTLLTRDLKQAIGNVKTSGELISSSANELKIAIEKINNGNGTVATLLNDSICANHLKQSIINIENSTMNFNENMEALKQSFLLRGYFKRQEKIKLEDKKSK